MSEALESYEGIPEELIAEPDDAPLTPDPSGKMTNFQRLQRDSGLVQLMKRGVDSTVAGPMYGLSPRQARRIYKTYVETLEDLNQIDPKEHVEEMLANYDSAISDLALIARDAKNDNARVGATRMRLEAVRGKIELLQSLGLLPKDLGTVTLRDDFVRVVRVILAVLDAFEVDEEVQMAIVDAAEGRKPQLPPGKEIIDVEDTEETDGGD